MRFKRKESSRNGITERCDAGLDYNWVRYVESNFVDGAILIKEKISAIEYDIKSYAKLAEEVVANPVIKEEW